MKKPGDKKIQRRGPPPAGDLSTVSYETSTDVDVAVDVQVSKTTSHEAPEVLFRTVVRQPFGDQFRYNEFTRFYRYYSTYQKEFTETKLSERTLRTYWNQWFGLTSNEDKTPYIDSIFISTGIFRHLKEFQGGLSLDHLPIGLKKVESRLKTGAFDLVFDPPRLGQKIDPLAIPMMDLSSHVPTPNALDPQDRRSQFNTLLEALTPASRQWWERLLAKHRSALIDSDDDLSLLLSFIEFTKQIELLNLSFDNAQLTEKSFYDVTDMRTAMANMLTILRHVSSRAYNMRYNDVEIEWAHIADLSLSSNGAIRGIYQTPPYGIILPQMQIDSAHYQSSSSKRHKYSLSEYSANRAKQPNNENQSFDNLDDLSNEDFETHFFRSLAIQEHRYSMAFYLEAAQGIREFKLYNHDPKKQQHAQRVLYQLLLRSTTGRSHFCALSEDDVLSRWKDILKLFQDFPLPQTGLASALSMGTRLMGFVVGKDLKKEISLLVMNLFYNLDSSPELGVLHRLSQLLSYFMRSCDISALRNIEESLYTDFNLLNQIVDNYIGEAMYDGMQFINFDEDVETYDKSSFHTYIGTVNNFLSNISLDCPIRFEDPNPKRYPLHLVRLISTFNLTAKDLGGLNLILSKSPFIGYHQQVTLLLKTLAEMNKVQDASGHRLHAADLEECIRLFGTTLSGSSKPNHVINFVKERFQSYYPDTYFFEKIPQSVLALITGSFTRLEQDKVHHFLEQLQRSGQPIQYEKIVNQMKQIVESITPIERSLFINQLNQILPSNMKEDAPDNLSMRLETLLAKLTDPWDGQKHCRAFRLFLDLKQKLPEAQQTPLNSGLLPQLTFWLDNHLYMETIIQEKSVPRARATELSVRLLMCNTPFPPETDINLNQELINIYESILIKFPAVSDNLWIFLQRYQGTITPSPTVLKDAFEHIKLLDKVFSLLSSDQVLSLCFHFDGSKEQGLLAGRTPHGLLTILQRLEGSVLVDEDKHAVLSMMVGLLNQEKGFDIHFFETIVSTIKTTPFLLKAIKRCYMTVPYPGFDTFKQWVLKSNEYELDEKIHQFSLMPSQRESGREGEKRGKNNYKNGFDIDIARKTIIQGVELSEKELQFLETYTNEVRACTSDELLEKLHQYRWLSPTEDEDIAHARLAALTAIVAELLYKIKSIDSPEMGSSYEINTTQYLAIYAALKAGKINRDVISEMGTGEGKSRCIALLNACGLAQGKTVDCLTSSRELATRDYLEYLAFYQSICNKFGVRVQLISVDSPIIDYCQGGLHLSEVSHIQRFRNKAKVIGERNRVLNPEPTQRMLNIDEADLLRLYHTDGKYTLSSAPDPDWQKMPWIYNAVMDFFAEDDIQGNTEISSAYKGLIDADDDAFNAFDERFLSFLVGKGYLPLDDFRNILREHPERLDELYLAAYNANRLEYKQRLGFAIEADVMQDLPEGPAQYSKVFPSADKAAKFSLGVQQCLAARLNRYYAIIQKQKQNPKSLSNWETNLLSKLDPELSTKLSECEKPFDVGVQKQAEYISSNSDLFEDYKAGSTFCYTGTSGESYETKELTGATKELTGATKELTGATILKIPRHFGLKRKDKAIALAQNNEGHLDALVKNIIAIWRRNQPILHLCEDDKSAKLLYEKLEKALRQENPEAKIQYVSSETTGDALAKQVKMAGQSKTITIASEKFGRGTDIKLDEQSQKAGGLATIITYLPGTERELEQMFSRSARFGEPGETRLILNVESLNKLYGSSSLKRDFYLEPEAFIKRLIARSNRRKQCERVILDDVNHFRAEIGNIVINNIYPVCQEDVAAKGMLSQKDRVRALWSQCLQDMDSRWGDISSELKGSLDPFNPNIVEIKDKLTAYRNDVAKRWADFSRDLSREGVHLTLEEVPTLELSDKAQKVLSPITLKEMVNPSIVAYHEYDAPHNGRAIIYTKPFVKLRAILRGERSPFSDLYAWYRGEGVLWPNIQAWREGKLGEMTFLQALMSYNGTFTQFLMGTDTSTLKQATESATNHEAAGESEILSLNELFKDTVSKTTMKKDKVSDTTMELVKTLGCLPNNEGAKKLRDTRSDVSDDESSFGSDNEIAKPLDSDKHVDPHP